MARFEYVRPASLAEAVSLLGDPGHVSRPLAGGTDILVYIRQAVPPFDRVVDITRIGELKVIERRGTEVVIGAGVTFSEAAASSLLREAAECLVLASLSVGGPAIRNTGTLGGNVMNAAACADAVPALICLDAIAHLDSVQGSRSVAVSDLIEGANRTDARAGELLTHFSFPIPPPGVRQAFTKLGRRNAQAISRLSVAAAGRLDGKGCVDYIRLVPGAAMPSPRRLTEVEGRLLGQPLDDALLAAAGGQTAEVMIQVTGRRWSTEYKEVAIRSLAERTLRRALLA